MQARHGGDVYRHEVTMDFSVNINPLGIEQHMKEAILQAVDQCEQYPDLDCMVLRQAIAQHHRLNPEQIVCGNGASDLFQGIVRWIMPKKALVLAPSFSGYVHALDAVDCQIVYHNLLEMEQFEVTERLLDDMAETLDMMFLCSPNNPTGTVIAPALLEKIIKCCEEKNIYLVMDQCFLEFTGFYTELGAEQYLKDCSHIIIVNAFTKTFAIPGIRLGYACSNKEVIEQIKRQLSEWNISIPAMAAGLAALETYKQQHPHYMEQAIALLNEERKYLQEVLKSLGINTYPTKADYILLKTSVPLYDALLKRGILIRHCNNYEGLGEDYYRIAIKKHEMNERLIQNIAEIL